MVSTMVSKTTSLSSSLSTPAINLTPCMDVRFIFLIGVICISNYYFKFLIYLIILIFFICIFFTPTIFNSSDSSLTLNSEILAFNPDGFVWPTPGYTRINSYFGKRNAPTAGASTFHKGIDIGAPEGTSFIAVADGEITFTNFLGGGGYTITLTVRKF